MVAHSARGHSVRRPLTLPAQDREHAFHQRPERIGVPRVAVRLRQGCELWGLEAGQALARRGCHGKRAPSLRSPHSALRTPPADGAAPAHS